MALDIAIVQPPGPPRHFVSISLPAHDEIQQAAELRSCEQLLRMHDYWGDVIEYDLQAVMQLADELEKVLPGLSAPAGSACQDLLALVRLAIASKQPLHALPD
jgi:hypothetical protein